MEQEIPFKRKSEFQHISEILPKAMDRILNRAGVAKKYPLIPDDVAGQIKWVEENLIN